MRLWHKSIRKQLKLIAGETRVETGQPSEHNPADPLHMQYPLYYQHAAQKQALWKQKNKLLAYWHVTERGKKKFTIHQKRCTLNIGVSPTKYENLQV